MTNPTSNYGFVLPTSSDLVTDLPADFDVALQGVDTRLKALQPGTTLGDIAYSSATANTNTRLPIGSAGQVLAVSGGGVPAWTTTADVTPLTTKGDLFTYTTADARLGVGTDGQTLVADSSTATGLKWAAASSGAVTQIADTTLGSAAADITFSSIASSYNHLMIIISGQCSSAGTNGTDLKVQLNSDTGGNYRYARNTKYATSGATVTIEGSGASTSLDMGNVWCGTATGGSVASVQMTFPNYKGTTLQKTMIFTGGASSDAPGAGSGIATWQNTAAITTIKIFSANGGNLNTGTRATLYGWT